MSEYDDIINLPHHQSKNHKPMSRINRAAQFAPFAALTGFGAAISETARLTNEKLELDVESINILNRQIQIILDNISQKPLIEVMYFIADSKKSGGEYVTVSGNVRKIDEFNQEVIFTDGLRIPMEDIYRINIL